MNETHDAAQETPEEVFTAKIKVIERALSLGDIYGKVELADVMARNTQDPDGKKLAIIERNTFIGEAYIALYALALAINHIYQKDQTYQEYMKKLRDQTKRDNLDYLWSLMAEMDAFLNKAEILEYGRQPTVKELLERFETCHAAP